MNVGYELLKNCIPVLSCRKFRDNGDLLIVMNEEREIFYLNDTAKMIYMYFDGKHKISDVLDMMKSEFEAENESDENILQSDLVTIIRDFQWQKVIKLMEE